MKVILGKNPKFIFWAKGGSFMSLINFTLTKIILSQLKIILNSPSRMSKLIWQASFPVPNKMKFQVFCVVPHIINLFKDTGQRDSEPFWGSQRLVNAYWRVQELAIGPDRWVRRSARPLRGSGKPAKVSERPVRGCLQKDNQRFLNAGQSF